MESAMIYAPVMIITCNRYEHLSRCINSLKKNTYADQTELYISVDYPPNENYRAGWEKVCQLLKEPLEGFYRVHVFFQEKNLGMSRNYQYLESIIFDKYDRLIYTEDDNEFSVNFLAYMDKGLELYKEHAMVFGICGYADDNEFQCGEDNVVPLTNFSAWGMGVWREKEKIIQEQLVIQNWLDAAKHVKIMWNLYSRRKRLFSRMLGTITRSLDDMKLLNTDINRGIFLAINGFCTINPVKTKVRNWGWDGSGQNIMGDREGNIRHTSLELDENDDFEYKLSEIRINKYNDRLLDSNDEWNRERSKWYNDPLVYVLYRLMGRELFLKFVQKG